MTQEISYDDLLYTLLCQEDDIYGFFDSIFRFLYERTDFFKLRSSNVEETGLLPGEAEKIVKLAFCKYMTLAVENQTSENDAEVPLDYINEETVISTELDPVESPAETEISSYVNKKAITTEVDPVKSPSGNKMPEKNAEKQNEVENDKNSQLTIKPMDPDAYNGAIYDAYSWSQSLKDVDAHIKVPSSITAGKQVRVDIQQSHIKTEALVNEEWQVIKDGDLSSKVNVEESTWTLVPGEHIHICLQKLKEKWWDSFFVDEPKIDLKTIDSSIWFHELDHESQTKIQELMFNEHQKKLGKPTIQQRKMEVILKDAWDKDGSPFKGQQFDPSIVDLGNDGS